MEEEAEQTSSGHMSGIHLQPFSTKTHYRVWRVHKDRLSTAENLYLLILSLSRPGGLHGTGLWSLFYRSVVWMHLWTFSFIFCSSETAH